MKRKKLSISLALLLMLSIPLTGCDISDIDLSILGIDISKIDLALEGEIEQTINEYGEPEFRGILRNNDNTETSYAEINFTLYDKDGNEIGEAFDTTDHITFGRIWKFEAVTIKLDGEYDHYDFEIKAYN